MGRLIERDARPIVAELLAMGLVTEGELASHQIADHRMFLHEGKVGGKPGDRALGVQVTLETYDLEDAFLRTLGIRTWRHVSVSVIGQLQARLADQKVIGRVRRPGERSHVPLPDWYELCHIAYEHAAEVGFDPTAAVWQYLPGTLEPALNIAEALHLRQPR
jgi:hypothetical protein